MQVNPQKLPKNDGFHPAAPHSGRHDRAARSPEERTAMVLTALQDIHVGDEWN